jgi:thioredoxin-like negative regulator of GroEL
MDIDRILHLTNNNELNNLDMIRKCIQTKPVIIFIVSPWCGHCQRLDPTIDTLEKEIIDEPKFNKVHIIKINNDMTKKVNIKSANSVPTISLFNKGEHVSDHEGYRNSKSIKDFMSNNLNISRNSRSLKPNKRNCRNSIKRKSIASRHSKPIGYDELNTKKSLNIKGGKIKKKKGKKKNTKKKKSKK